MKLIFKQFRIFQSISISVCRRSAFLLLFSIVLIGCKFPSKRKQVEVIPISIPSFSVDSAYQFIQTQVDFGARVPNTEPHRKCADYLSVTLTRMGAEVVNQKADLVAFDGTILKAVNVIGSFNPQAKSRILLCAHWDSRPWADHDTIESNRKTPVIAANDGASGVGVLLEIARLLQKQLPKVGVDIVFFDAEDYGMPHGEENDDDSESSWCLGSQHWSKNPHKKGYTAMYGILLDMVGAPNATFYREQYSDYYASNIVTKVWSTANSLGFSQYFIDSAGSAITDDHVFVNRLIKIPCINIIDYDTKNEKGFRDYWHTTNDTMENIDKNTLLAVGMTMLNVIYSE